MCRGDSTQYLFAHPPIHSAHALNILALAIDGVPWVVRVEHVDLFDHRLGVRPPQRLLRSSSPLLSQAAKEGPDGSLLSWRCHWRLAIAAAAAAVAPSPPPLNLLFGHVFLHVDL